MGFWSFSNCWAFSRCWSIPSWAVISGFRRRLRLRASWSSLLLPHRSASRSFFSGGVVVGFSFFFSVVFVSFFRKRPSGVMVACLCLMWIKELLRLLGAKSFYG